METIILNAIKICQKEIQDNPMLILSESDFERLLAHNISILISKSQNEAIKKFVVHTQVSFYCNSILDRRLQHRVDILIVNNEKITINNNHKGIHYDDQSYVIEVKYFRKGDSYTTIDRDFNKANKILKTNSCYFVVALLNGNTSKLHKSIVNKYQNTIQSLDVELRSKFHLQLIDKKQL